MIATLERVLFLKSIDIFANIPSEMLVGVAQLAREDAFEDGDVVISEGDVGECLYVIVQGEVRVVRGNIDVARLGERECVGEMSLLDAEPRSATVLAAGETRLLRIDQEPFFELLAERSELSRRVITMLTRRLRGMLKEHQSVW